MVDLPHRPGQFGELARVSESVRVTRRSVTAMLVGSAAALSQVRGQSRIAPDTPLAPIDPDKRFLDVLDLTTSPKLSEIRRPDDFLVLNYRLHNLKVIGSAPSTQIVRVNPIEPGWIVVEHQPQSIAEQAYWERPSADYAPMPGGALSRISGVSRVVFQMPSEIGQADWGLDGLLDACRRWPMRLHFLAEPATPEVFRYSPFRALKLSQQRLDDATQVILSSLPPELRREIGVFIPAASQRIATAIEVAAASGESYSDAEVDALVGAEMRAGFARSRTALAFEHAFLSERALEAAATSRSLSVLAAIAAQPNVRPEQRFEPASRAGQDISRFLLLRRPQPLDENVTGIEVPYRLVQSPLATAGWTHAVAPVKRGERTELWHTRLGTRKGERVEDFAPEPLRALWSPDYALESCAPGFGAPPRWALYANERRDLVRLTAGYDEFKSKGVRFTPQPTVARELILSGLGAWIDLDGAWSVRPEANKGFSKVSIEGWTHRASLGRDYFVRVVKAGRLFPFGHAAALVRITERKFESHQETKARIAILRQRAFIIVREPVREYAGAGSLNEGRDFPFRRIEILTKTTPPLGPPGGSLCDKVFADGATAPSTAKCPHPEESSDVCFVPVVDDKTDFQFRLVGVDLAGRRIPFSAPLIMVLEERHAPQFVQPIIDFYTNGPQGVCSAAKAARNRVAMNGAVIQYAPQSAGGNLDGDTNAPTAFITFKGVKRASAAPSGEPQFVPAFDTAEVVLPAVKALLGADKAPKVRFNSGYLSNAFGGPNKKAQLFLDIVDGAGDKIGASAAAPSDKFGGLLAPDLTPTSLSRNFGVVTGKKFQESFGAGVFDPIDFFPDAKLLGAIDLKTILSEVADITTAAGRGRTPRFTTIELPDRIETTYLIEQAGLKSKEPLFRAMPGSKLKIATKLIAKRKPNAAPDAPETRIEGLLEHFQVNLYSCIILTFRKLSFVVEPGKKPKVDVDLDPDHGVIFGGALEFINALREVLPSNGFSDPAPITVTPAGISAGYSLGLPSIPLGICSISNISIGAAFTIPFTGAPPSARFNFAERHAPFNITVSMFGGGGFVAVVVDTGGMREIEILLEFGAKVEIDLGVASGGVYIKGGFFFHLKEQGETQSIYFEGFVELGGHLSVLCIITVSLVFHLALAYEKDGAAKKSRLFGQASLIVEIEILFFSTSVSVKVEKQFAGSNADPLFIDLIPTDEVWRQYCEAFA